MAEINEEGFSQWDLWEREHAMQLDRRYRTRSVWQEYKLFMALAAFWAMVFVVVAVAS